MRGRGCCRFWNHSSSIVFGVLPVQPLKSYAASAALIASSSTADSSADPRWGALSRSSEPSPLADVSTSATSATGVCGFSTDLV